MKVTALGHAGLRVETSGATLLCDPWFSPEGAFLGSWHQYPANDHLLADPSLTCPTALVISHEHLDHMDPWFLGRVPSHVPAVIPRYPSPALRRRITAAGARPVIELDQWQSYEVAPGTTLFYVSEPPVNHDSAVVIRGDGQTLLNLNDARLFPVQLREIRERVGGVVDLFFFQGAGASWYPMCYRYPPEQARKISMQKRMAKLGYCLKIMRVLEPTMGFPFAGPPVFLDPDLTRHNAEMDVAGIFPNQEDVAAFLLRKGLENVTVLLPGDSWDARTQACARDPIWEGFSFSERERYLAEYAERRQPQIRALLERYPSPTEPLWPAFRAYFERLLAASSYFNEKIGMRVGFDVTGPGGGAWTVDFGPASPGVRQGLDGCGYTYRFASRWARPLIDGSLTWDDFFLSLRFEAWRDPDLYNDHLLMLLKFAEPEALAAVEAFEGSRASDERITVHSGGAAYSIARYCPHAGNDLRDTGEVLPGGIIRCLAHHYDFDLETGRCITGFCPALDVRRL